MASGRPPSRSGGTTLRLLASGELVVPSARRFGMVGRQSTPLKPPTTDRIRLVALLRGLEA
eukprot:8684154-Alexandrium_andersonii.AAC.1